MHRTRLKKQRDPERLSPLFFVCSGIAVLSLILYLVAVASPTFAAAFHGTVGRGVRALLAHMTSFLPFSLAEILLYCVPLLLIGIGIYAYRRRCGTWKSTLVFLATLLSVLSLFFSLFVFSFGMGYHTDTLDTRLGWEVGEVKGEELYQTALYLAAEVNAAAGEVTFGEDGFSKMPYGMDGMNDRLLAAYGEICAEYDFVQRLDSRVKPVLASKLMSYTHITGIYTYFTGEANVNVYFPDYTLPFTAAHELAHQRGIAREDEANFIAFLVAVRSDDPYVRYSGYLNLFEYVANALYYTDSEGYAEVISVLCPEVRGELRAYAAFFEEFRDSAASDVSDAVNDAYLKLHGNSAGIQSYGLVVKLAVAYVKQLPV